MDESPVTEQSEGDGDNTGKHRIIVNNDKISALVEFLQIGKAPQLLVRNVDGFVRMRLFELFSRSEVNQNRIL